MRDDSWTEYPMAVFTWVANALIGRGFLYIFVLFTGYALGAFTVDWLWEDLATGFLEFPGATLVGLFCSVGLLVMPMT